MKTLSVKQKAKNFLKLTLLSLLSMAAIVSCSKKNDDGAAQPPVLPTVSCANGQVAPAGYTCLYNDGALFAGSGNLVNNVQFSHSSIGLEGVVSLTASSTNSYVDFNDPRIPAKYSGAFTAQGTVNISSDVYCNGIPLRGTYTLTGTQGMYSWGVLSGFVWNLVGPANLQLISSGPSVLVGDMNGLSRDGNNRIGLSVTVHVNSQYCGYIYTR